jgi:hypothetical protein
MDYCDFFGGIKGTSLDHLAYGRYHTKVAGAGGSALAMTGEDIWLRLS